MGFLSGLVGAVGDLGSAFTGGLVNHYFGKKAAKQSYGYSLSMSNSAHQREVKDLEAAGLNPVLSAMGNGAATVAVPVSPGFSGDGNQITTALNSAMSRKLQREQIKTQEALTNKNQADAAKALAEASLVKQESDYVRGKGTTAGVSPFDNKYYGGGVLGMNSSARDISRLGGEFFRAFQRFPRPVDAGTQGGRNSSKSIQFDKEEEDNYRKAAEEFFKSPYRKKFSGFL